MTGKSNISHITKKTESVETLRDTGIDIPKTLIPTEPGARAC